ncbi:hypothetical protein SRB5_32220 [Streptomyces sp. RB5]|uniref:Peptidase inhibitor family I36 n=1 Tax=Streptomyces smaragdinus TaxID=2585196 RepID=A0A7K0CJ76_9ACTN|nr:hypothetical protein [Streptomyces smaragdinus]
MRLRLLALAGATALATLALNGGPAVAATKCASGSLCTWSGTNFTGTKHTYNTSPGCGPASGRSVSNQSGHTIRVHSSTSCYGSYFTLKSGYSSSSTPFAIKSIAVYG